MPPSDLGVQGAKHYEGVGPKFDRAKKLCFPYVCPAGKLTAGHGHVVGPGELKRFQKGITLDEADKLLRTDLARFWEAIKPLVKVTLQWFQEDALVLFAYNVGIAAFHGSTLLRKLNKGDYIGAAEEFMRWCKATVNGKLTTLKGLQYRRATEHHLFLTGELVYVSSDEQMTALLGSEKLHLQKLKPTLQVIAHAPVHIHDEWFAVA